MSSPGSVLAVTISSSILAMCAVMLSCFIIYNLCRSENNNEPKKKVDKLRLDPNRYELRLKIFIVVAVILFAFYNIFIAIDCIWIYVELDINLDNEIYIDLPNIFIDICVRIIVLYICNAKLYYTFITIPGLRVSKKFYYIFNIFAIIILPILGITGFIASSFFDNFVARICFDGYRYITVILFTYILITFNRKLYGVRFAAIRNFKAVKMNKIRNNEMDTNSINNKENIGRTNNHYMSIMDDNKNVYVLFNIIIRCSLLICLIDLSMLIYTICWNIRWFSMKHSAVTIIFPYIYGSFDSCLNSLCLLLFYSNGDRYYRFLCQCNKNKKCKCCAMHYGVAKCCVCLATPC